MPTCGWIQETAIDRFYERGASNVSYEPAPPPVYSCRVCKQEFKSITERDFHELTHPIRNPLIAVLGKEIGSNRFVVKHALKYSDIECKFVDKIILNGVRLKSAAELKELIAKEKQKFFSIELINDVMHKKIEIEMQVAEHHELKNIDELFLKWFRFDDFNEYSIEQFIVDAQHYKTADLYVDGIVRYLQGIMAKDNRTTNISFEDYYKRFNQALDRLTGYRTALSNALIQLIKFNLNDFTRTNLICGIPILDQSLDLFEHKKSDVSDISSSIEQLSLPVDNTTGFIFDELIRNFEHYSLTELEYIIEQNNNRNISLQDRAKIHFIAYKKATDVKDEAKVIYYAKRIKFDGVFAIEHSEVKDK